MNQTTDTSSRTADEHSLKDTLRSTAEDVREKAQETGRQIAKETEDKARRLFADQRNSFAEDVRGFAKAFHSASRNLGDEDYGAAARFSEELAGEVERFAEFIREKRMSEIIDSVEDFGRRKPALFFGGMFAVGILLARFLKSSSLPSLEAPRGYLGQGAEYPPGTDYIEARAVDYQKVV